ncbi:hypothetical protein S83_023394, partial [Arachis hypogaea]
MSMYLLAAASFVHSLDGSCLYAHCSLLTAEVWRKDQPGEATSQSHRRIVDVYLTPSPRRIVSIRGKIVFGRGKNVAVQQDRQKQKILKDLDVILAAHPFPSPSPSYCHHSKGVVADGIGPKETSNFKVGVVAQRTKRSSSRGVVVGSLLDIPSLMDVPQVDDVVNIMCEDGVGDTDVVDYGDVVEHYGDVVELTEDDILRKVFRSEDDAYEFYKKLGKFYGFGIRRGDMFKDEEEGRPRNGKRPREDELDLDQANEGQRDE